MEKCRIQRDESNILRSLQTKRDKGEEVEQGDEEADSEKRGAIKR